jgi:hypothetical protein
MFETNGFKSFRRIEIKIENPELLLIRGFYSQLSDNYKKILLSLFGTKRMFLHHFVDKITHFIDKNKFL